ncbi:MAG: hypothetical protein AAGI22_14845 [Planctomycetota bacterium]
MKRLVLRSVIVVASIAVTLLVLEVGYRVVLSAQGEGHSSEARRAAYEGRLEWVLRPHGPIAMGATAIDEVDEEDLVEAVQGTVLSPYIGVDRVELLTGSQELSEYFATPEAERTFDVVMLGGSVATILAADADASAALEALIAEDPRLEGRPVRLHNQARAGFKAPQTSILCDLHFQLGFRPDLVVLLDGFNEVALANENRRQGGHPLYPSVTNWSHLTPEVDLTSEDIASLAEMRLASESSRRILVGALRYGLYRTALGSRLVDAMLAKPAARQARAIRSLEVRGDGVDMPLALRGPEPPPDLETALKGMIRVWVESSTSLAAACHARGIPFLHVLQPTLYDVGAKPISEHEARTCLISDEWKEGVVPGYPLLRENGAELRRRGIDFHDASRIFSDWTGDLYYDSCHLTPPGSLELARSIGEAARTLDDLVPASR